MGDHSGTARVVPFFFVPLLPLLLLGPAARCLCRASLVSFGSQTTRLEELNQRRYSSSRTCTHAHRWLAVSLLCCSRGARGLANRPIAPSPSRRLALACEEGCAYAEPLCSQSVSILAHPLRRSSVASQDDDNKMTISLDTSPSLGHHTLPRTSLIDRASFQRFVEMELVTVVAPWLRGTRD